jgi:hypothetical protein
MKRRTFITAATTVVGGTAFVGYNLLVNSAVEPPYTDPRILIHRDGNNLVLDVVGGIEPFQFQRSEDVTVESPIWVDVGPPTYSRHKVLSLSDYNHAYFRVKTALQLLEVSNGNLQWQIPNLN